MSTAERDSHLPFRIARWTTLLAIAASGLSNGCGKDDQNAFVAPPPPDVVVALPLEREVTRYLTYTGVVEAAETVQLRARVQGFLEKINFRPGQAVKKGDVLFVIDKRSFQAEVDRAQAVVKGEEAALVGVENDAKLARDLANQKAGPEIDAIIKAAKRDATAAELAGAKATLDQASLNLEYCDVTAPIDGRVTKNLVDIGNLVGNGESTPLATIVETQPAYVSIDVSESDVLDIQRRNAAQPGGVRKDIEPGQVEPGKWRLAELALTGESDFSEHGNVDYVDPQLNRDTGTLRVRARFENADEKLKPGLFARVRFPMDTFKASLVPDAALLSDQSGRFALVVNEKDEVEMRRVHIGMLEGSLRVVEDGLQPTDRVIVLGVLKARPGSKVTPKTEEAPAAAPTSQSTDQKSDPGTQSSGK